MTLQNPSESEVQHASKLVLIRSDPAQTADLGRNLRGREQAGKARPAGRFESFRPHSPAWPTGRAAWIDGTELRTTLWPPGSKGPGNLLHGGAPMLVLSRKKSETIVLPELGIEITIVEIRGDKVKVGIEADKSITVHRKEVHEAIERNKRGKNAP